MQDTDFDITLDHPTTDFTEKVLALAQARQDLSDFERDQAKLLMQHQLLKNIAAKQEEELRAAALAHYESTGDLAPHDAIKIKMMTRREYDDAENFKRALERREAGVLKLDTAAVRKLEADWVVYTEKTVPTPNIQSKLGEYLVRSDLDNG